MSAADRNRHHIWLLFELAAGCAAAAPPSASASRKPRRSEVQPASGARGAAPRESAVVSTPRAPRRKTR
eukprot:703015-Pleurochrysis_carterae.AAC.2